MPTRIQRRRIGGWRIPVCSCGCGKPARYVGRGTRWGNPWRVVHDLACWCPPGRPCHADTLLDLANKAL